MTLKVITIILIVFTGITVLLSLAAFTNYFPVVKIMTLIVWIIAVLSIAQIVIYTAFYDPFAGSATKMIPIQMLNVMMRQKMSLVS